MLFTAIFNVLFFTNKIFKIYVGNHTYFRSVDWYTCNPGFNEDEQNETLIKTI